MNSQPRLGHQAALFCLKKQIARILFGIVLLCMTILTKAQSPPPPDTNAPPWLNYWSFRDSTNWASDYGYTPLRFTNITASALGDGSAVVIDSTNAALLQYRVFESDGFNLAVTNGSVVFWFAPNWSSTNVGGTGPGQSGRLLEVGTFTTNASYGWWSIYVNAAGTAISFGAQTNDDEYIYITAPIEWETNQWHHIALTYTPTNSALYIDGISVTNGDGVVVYPSNAVLTNGFCIGSDTNGLLQAHGMFDSLSTYDYPLNEQLIAGTFLYESFYYYLDPLNSANFSAQAYTNEMPVFRAVSGSGDLLAVSTNTSGCSTSTNIWITNAVAALGTNGLVTVTFSIAGGSNGVPYDVFANAILGPTNNPAYEWVWLGQGYRCTTYSVVLTNQPNLSAYLQLGTALDSDFDGLTDAYELLVSHTLPNQSDTSQDGMLDGWKVLWGLKLFADNPTDENLQVRYAYGAEGWLNALTGIRQESITPDAESNILNIKP
jgi:hypothetical protein